MFGLEPLQFGGTARTGFGQWLGEFIATFGLIATILGCVRFKPDALPPITSAYWFTSSTSFANPAVTIARVCRNCATPRAGFSRGRAPRSPRRGLSLPLVI
jgi:hypothetical protein